MRIAIAVGLLAAMGCGGPESNGSSEPAPVTEPTRAEPTEPDGRYADAPAGTEAIARQLQARHREDLPDRATLSAHPDPEASLRWLVVNGDPLLLRVRAASALRFFDDAETLALLRSVFGDESLPGNLRAAAVEGTAGAPLDSSLRAELEAAAASDDPRLSRAARARLEESEPAATAP